MRAACEAQEISTPAESRPTPRWPRGFSGVPGAARTRRRRRHGSVAARPLPWCTSMTLPPGPCPGMGGGEIGPFLRQPGSADVKGDAYEGLLERNAQDVKGGAGQYFTPRPLIQAIVDCVRPAPNELICDPACGTGGFLLAAHDYIANNHYELDTRQKRHLQFDALRGVELVPGVARLCAMNLFLHGIGPDDASASRRSATDDALRDDPGDRFDVVLTNPPFGKKSSITIVNEEGETGPGDAHLRPRRLLDDDQEQATQLRPARQDAAEDQRPRRRRRARQRAVRGRRGRDGPPEAPARVRRPHPAAAPDRHLLRPGRQGERPLLRPQARRARSRGRRCSGSTTSAPTCTSPSRQSR